MEAPFDSPPTVPDPTSSMGQHQCAQDNQVYEAIAMDSKLDLPWRLIENFTHEHPDLPTLPGELAMFRSRLLEILDVALQSCGVIDKNWCSDKRDRRTKYLRQHNLGTANDDTEPDSAPPWHYLLPLRELFKNMIELTDVYTKLFQMTKWSEAFEHAGNHGRAEIVS